MPWNPLPGDRHGFTRRAAWGNGPGAIPAPRTGRLKQLPRFSCWHVMKALPPLARRASQVLYARAAACLNVPTPGPVVGCSDRRLSNVVGFTWMGTRPAGQARLGRAGRGGIGSWASAAPIQVLVAVSVWRCGTRHVRTRGSGRHSPLTGWEMPVSRRRSGSIARPGSGAGRCSCSSRPRGRPIWSGRPRLGHRCRNSR